MKQIFESPVMVHIELSVIEDIIKIIGNAVHSKYSHDEVTGVMNFLKKRGQEAYDDNKRSQVLPQESYEFS